MIVINSAAYVINEFQSELGEIPPCMLPLGNHKLIQHQVKLLRAFENERIIVSLPLSYNLTLDEKFLIDELSIDVVFIPDNFSLANTLIYILNVVDSSEKNVRLLHGDTLIYDLPRQLDVVSVAKALTDYKWEAIAQDHEKDSNLVWAGFFSFSDKNGLLKNLSLANGDFVKAIHLYSAEFDSKNIQSFEWFDLGHINTYFVSRSKITTQRSFNSLIIQDGILYKSGKPFKKIEAEANWFQQIPTRLKKYIPHIISVDRNDHDSSPYYAMEYLPFLPLNEIYVHGRNSIFFWNLQFDLLKRFLFDSRFLPSEMIQKNITKIEIDTQKLYIDKNIKRIKEYMVSNDYVYETYTVHLNKNAILLKDIVEDCINKVGTLPIVNSFMHGDLCFSNILYDSRSQKIKVIDPRGINSYEELTLFGDQKYDLAKLTHSVIGMYDFIISGRYKIKKNDHNHEYIEFELDERLSKIQDTFLGINFIDNVTVKQILPLVVLLFLSMLPLHSDRQDRQKAMFLNAIRLYDLYILD